MSALPHASLLCPNCYQDFRVAAWRVLPGAEIGCPHCHQIMRFDASKPEHRHTIDRARAARKKQRERIENHKSLLTARAEVSRPMPEDLEELVRRLRELLAMDPPPERRRG